MTGEITLKSSVIGDLLKMVFQPLVFSGLVLYVISTLLWLLAFSKTTLTFAYPFTGRKNGTLVLKQLILRHFRTYVPFVGRYRRHASIVSCLPGVYSNPPLFWNCPDRSGDPSVFCGQGVNVKICGQRGKVGSLPIGPSGFSLR